MKNLKKLSRNDLKEINGGRLPGGGSCRISVQYAGGGYGVFDTPTTLLALTSRHRQITSVLI
jgi:hypothetical protein